MTAADLDRAEERVDNLVALGRDTEPSFHQTGTGAYRFMIPKADTVFEVDHLRRERGQLKGEVLTRCEIKGARTIGEGVLDVSDVNLSSNRARKDLAKTLEQQAQTKEGDPDWTTLVGQLAFQILFAERQGEPAVNLAELGEPEADRIHEVEGLPLLAAHPLILFGDGGTGKSTLALWFAGKLAQKGIRVGYFDWEMDQHEHRRRLGKLFPGELPAIHYARCSRAFAHESERLRGIVRKHRLDYVVLDSIAAACDGRPEDAEVAVRYQQALRGLGEGVGSLHVAHVSKAFEGNDRKPFGSVFWSNLARSTWNVKQAEGTPGDPGLHVALHNRKANITARHRSLGFELSFSRERIGVRPVDPAEVDELASQLSVSERVRHVLKRGPMKRKALEDELEDVSRDTLSRTVRRMKNAGRVLDHPDRGLQLVERRL